MSTTYHLCMDVENFMRQHRKLRDYEGMFRHSNGHLMTPREARDHLRYQLLGLNRKVIPCTNDCNNFDYEKGCQGHVVADEHAS